MSTANEQQPSAGADNLKWVLVTVLLVGAVVANSYFSELAVYIRAAGVLLVTAGALALAATTVKGQQALSFAKESRTEVRKVVWPTRQEAMQTTLIVLAATGVMSIVLWGLDGILVRIVGMLIGTGA